MCQNFNLPIIWSTITGKSEPDYCEFVWYHKTSAFISKQRDINFKSKRSAIYKQLHEENNPTDLFFNAKKPQTNQPWEKKTCLLKKTVTIIRVIHYLSPTQLCDFFYYNHRKVYWLKTGLGISHHLTCSPSWYWTAACIASTSLSTRSFHVLFKASQAELSCKQVQFTPMDKRTLLLYNMHSLITCWSITPIN